jgi:hypothetical protein
VAHALIPDYLSAKRRQKESSFYTTISVITKFYLQVSGLDLRMPPTSGLSKIAQAMDIARCSES